MRLPTHSFSLSLLVLAACSTPAAPPSHEPDPPVAAHAPPPTAQPAAPAAVAEPAAPPTESQRVQRVRAAYDKREVMIPMRDGIQLHTALYVPKDRSRPFPILMRRTPYSCRPYGADKFPESPGPNDLYTEAGYAFAIQDVRGAYMSQGEFVDVRPHRAEKRGPGDVDESSDTFDTVDWLVKNVEGNNGRVGMWGISYPGFYAAAGMIDAHPALKAVSPQAPIADWWFDDFHHHGALFLPHAFLFLSSFGWPRPEPVAERGGRFSAGTPDGWDFFLRSGSPHDVGRRHLHGGVPFWNDLMAHPNYDAFWQERNLLPHLNGVTPAVMTVGGLFDAEDLFGPLAIYREVERRNPGIFNVLVMGPWVHGGWARTDGDALGQARFGTKTGPAFRAEVEKPFFDHFLLDAPAPDLPEAMVFDTGANTWRRFDAWPPPAQRRWLSLENGSKLALAERNPLGAEGPAIEFVSDPAKPVPHTQAVTLGMNKEYMAEDQRFAARRPDVLVFQTEPLETPLTLAGGSIVHLRVKTDGTDADWIVKLVDVFPDDTPDPKEPALAPGQRAGGYQMLVRGEVMPGRFRDGYEQPVPFEPDVFADVRFHMWDVLHTFEKGHRIQIQVQSTWFPLVARNPQTFLANPYEAKAEDYRRSVHAIAPGSCVQVGVWAGP